MALWILQKIYNRVIIRETYASYPYFLITKAVVFLRNNSSHSFVSLQGGSAGKLSACLRHSCKRELLYNANQIEVFSEFIWDLVHYNPPLRGILGGGVWCAPLSENFIPS